MRIIERLKNYLLIEISYPLLDMVMRTKIHSYLHEIEEMNTWSENDIVEWQHNKIQELVLHFYNNTIYYKRLFDELKIDPKDIKTRSDLSIIPHINKDIVREHYEELIPRNLNNFSYKKATTGGSSGKTMKYILDLKSWSYTTAVKIYSWQTSGYLYGNSYATVGSSSLFPTSPSIKQRLYHFVRGSVQISAMDLSEEKIALHIKRLQQKKVKYMYGYASGLYLIAKYLNDNNLKVLSVKGCFSTAEMLTPEYRLEIEKAFGFVMDCYGARDGGLTAYEINKGSYNVSYNSIAEVVDCYNNGTGTLLVTDLLNFTFPLIRYEVEDDVCIDTESSRYNGQVFTKIMGRSPDIIRLPNGRVLTGVGFQVMFGRLNVNAYRIVKSAELELSLEIQPTQKFSEEEETMLIGMVKKQAGNDCNVIIKKVANFVANKNGKRNYFMASPENVIDLD